MHIQYVELCVCHVNLNVKPNHSVRFLPADGVVEADDGGR